MRYTLLVVLFALCATPLAAQIEAEAPARLTVTPFVGWRFAYTADADQIVIENGQPVLFFTRQEVSGGALAGLEAEYAVWGPWSVAGAFAFGPGSDIDIIQLSDSETEQFFVEGGSTYLARVAAQFQLPEPSPLGDQRLHRPSAYIFAGPAVVAITPPDLLGTVAAFDEDPYIQFAANFGIRAAGDIPWWDDIGFMLLAEDYWTFWNDEELVTRNFVDEAGLPTTIEQDPNHIFAFRAGLTWRIGSIR